MRMLMRLTVLKTVQNLQCYDCTSTKKSVQICSAVAAFKIIYSSSFLHRLTNDSSWARVETLKVPKCEIFDRSYFHYFYTIKPFWIDDYGVKILTYFFKFWGSQASFSFLCAS
jgi:hypothetical protein